MKSGSFVPPPKNSTVSVEEGNKNGIFYAEGEIGIQSEVASVESSGDVVGIIDVYIHQARDIHNVCIYHKQDVYAKLCLTNDPETSVSSKIVHGGGRNPQFNENLKLNVKTVDASLKCEMWMLSRVRNYLEDQLLGIVLLPLTEIIVEKETLMKEFILSSTDLFHSPAGFVQLSLSYIGSTADILTLSSSPSTVTKITTLMDSETDNSFVSALSKIEFPDPKVVSEDLRMVSEYIAMPPTDQDSPSSESLITSDNANHLRAPFSESASESRYDPVQPLKGDTPVSIICNNGSSSSQSYDFADASEFANKDPISPLSEKNPDIVKSKTSSPNGISGNDYSKSVLNLEVEPKQTVVQQDIVDMYKKSMQQFTESLAKMKLPLDVDNGGAASHSSNSSSDEKSETPKSTVSKVFYGSRAFY